MRRAWHAFGGLALVGLCTAQQARKEEDGPQVLVHWCNEDGECEAEEAAFTIDASWRVQHNATRGGWQSCIIQDGMWQSRLCMDPLSCAKHCAVDGMDLDAYADVHGITELDDGIRLNYITATQYGLNIGSRLYMLDEDYKDYKIFKLKNREIAFDIDVSTIPCGVNAALYLVNMEKNGGKGTGNNDAGSRFGTGYCDAHCPHSSNFVAGQANMDWSWGSCCPEIDLFEGNNEAQAFTAHTCQKASFHRCDHPDECGDSDKGYHYEGVCDKDGCDFNTFRMGSKDFWGEGKHFTVNSEKPVTVITQFITANGKDDGPLKEIRRVYMQDGKEIQNAPSSIPGVKGDSISEDYCNANKAQFGKTRQKDNEDGDFNQFKKLGGMAKIGEALENGMAVAVSMWDDPGSNMDWLDAVSPSKHPKVKGAKRGPCTPDGNYKKVRRMHQLAHVKFENFMYGAIGSTVKAKKTDARLRLRRRFEQRRVRTRRNSRGQQRRVLLIGAIAAASAMGVLGFFSFGRLRRRLFRSEAGSLVAEADESSTFLATDSQ